MLTAVEEVVPISFSTNVIAAVVTGTVVLLVGVINVLVTLHQGRSTRKAAQLLADREQWWDRFTWAAEELFSPHEPRALVAISVLNSLAAVEWINQDDRAMIFNVFDVLNSDIDVEELEGASDGQG